jgi:hypothetical protein
MKLVWVIALVAGCRCGKTTCGPGQVDDHGTCRDVAATLQGLRWEMPCKPDHGDICTAAIDKPVKTATLGGDPAKQYDVTLHFRGVVEQQAYADGRAEQLWYIGGRSDNGNFNIYELQTSAPQQVFFLNAGKAGITNVWPLDYQKTIRVQGGATVTLSADAQDGRLIANVDANHKPVIVPDVPPAPQPFDGQFIQMDVVAVTPVP